MEESVDYVSNHAIDQLKKNDREENGSARVEGGLKSEEYVGAFALALGGRLFSFTLLFPFSFTLTFLLISYLSLIPGFSSPCKD